MNDPLSEVIALLQPRTVFSKRISGAGRWGVRYSDYGQPSFCAVLEGSCRLAVDGQRAPRLSVLVGLVADESTAQRSGRDLVLARLATAIRQMHAQLARPWTVAQ